MGEYIIYPSIGWLYLWMRYRNKEKVHRILGEKFNDSFYDAGASLSLKAIGVVLIILLIGLLCAVAISIFNN